MDAALAAALKGVPLDDEDVLDDDSGDVDPDSMTPKQRKKEEKKSVHRKLRSAVKAAQRGDTRKAKRLLEAAEAVTARANLQVDEAMAAKVAAVEAAGGMEACAAALEQVESAPAVRAAKASAKRRRKKAEAGWREKTRLMKQRAGMTGDGSNGAGHVLVYAGDAGTDSSSRPKKGHVRRHAGRAVMQTMAGVDGVHVAYTPEGWTSRRTQCCGIAYNDYELIPSDFVSPQASKSGSPVQPARSSYHRRVCLSCGKVTARDRGSAIAIMAVGRVRRVFNVSLWSRTTFEALLETI